MRGMMQMAVLFAGASPLYQCTSQCLLWVKSRHLRCKKSCPLCPRKRTFTVP